MRNIYVDLIKRKYKKNITNGCGPTFLSSIVPNFIFSDACFLHDLGIILGGTEKDRLRNDKLFLLRMLRESKNNAFYFVLSYFYYFCVSLFSHQYFCVRDQRLGLKKLVELLVSKKYSPENYCE